MRTGLFVLLCSVAWLAACNDGEMWIVTDDDDDDMADDDDVADDDDMGDDDDATDDDDIGDDDDDDDTTAYPPEMADVFLVYGYPATLESASVDAYLAIAGGSYNGQYWTYDDGKRRYTIRQYEDESGFFEGLATPGSIVVYAGHSNFGLGASFDPQDDHSEVGYIETVDDFFHYGSETVAINYELLRDNQAYPNFVLRPEDIVENPQNYLIDHLNVERFPNNQGVGPGDTFGIIGYDGSGIPYHYYDTHDGYYKTIVYGGELDIPDNLGFEVLFIRSCQSGRYYIHHLDQGVFFYSDGEASYDSAMVYRFIKGILEGWSYQEIVDELNSVDPIYGFFNFNQE